MFRVLRLNKLESFFGHIKTHCKKDIRDKHYELEPSGHVNLQNGKGGGGENGNECLKGDFGLVFI